MWIVIILVIGGFAALLIYGSWFPFEGEAKGIVTKVETEIGKSYQNPRRHMQMNTDCRLYRIYVQYLWQGQEYEAKSFVSYITAKYFPGDEVTVQVHKKDKTIVNILN